MNLYFKLYILILISIVIEVQNCYTQCKISGVIYDSIEYKPLPYGTVSNGNREGTTIDTLGHFSATFGNINGVLKIEALGYSSDEVSYSRDDCNTILDTIFVEYNTFVWQHEAVQDNKHIEGEWITEKLKMGKNKVKFDIQSFGLTFLLYNYESKDYCQLNADVGCNMLSGVRFKFVSDKRIEFRNAKYLMSTLVACTGSKRWEYLRTISNEFYHKVSDSVAQFKLKGDKLIIRFDKNYIKLRRKKEE